MQEEQEQEEDGGGRDRREGQEGQEGRHLYGFGRAVEVEPSRVPVSDEPPGPAAAACWRARRTGQRVML